MTKIALTQLAISSYVLGILVALPMASAQSPVPADHFSKKESVLESAAAVESILDGTLRCAHVSVGIGNGVGHVIGTGMSLWWQKRMYNKKHIQPLFTQVSLLRASAAGREHIPLVVSVFEDSLRADKRFSNKNCTELTELFFNSIEAHVQNIVNEGT